MKRYFELLWAITLRALVVTTAITAGAETNPPKTVVRAKDGLNIVCESRGKGDVALVFLHGWGGNRDYWKNQVQTFADDYRVITLDQPGHGESGKNRNSWTVSNLAEDIESVVNALRLKRVVLVGHSMGGPIALGAAARLPGKVLGVVGIDTLQNAEAARMPDDARQKFLGDLETNFTGTLEGMYSALLSATADPELKKWLTHTAQAQDPTMARTLIRDLLTLDPKPLFKNAKVPIRCINSAGGYQFFAPTAIDINRKYADFSAVLIDDVGHYPMLEKPAEFNEKLRAVLKELNRPK